MRLSYSIRIFIGIVLLIVSNQFTSEAQNHSKGYIDSCNLHLKLGIPTDKDTTDDYILLKPEYIISYNYRYNSANWAAWNLNSSWIGKTDRYSGKFITDTTLPEDFLKIKHDNYTNSGYDRGHIVRSHDRSSSEESNKSTFLMTNIIPQTPDLNRGVWLDFERFCDELALKKNKELYIYAGATYKIDSTFGVGIRVPDSCFKIVVVLERGEGLECVGYNTQIYSVMIPNINGIRKEKWEKYATSVLRIEKSTGYDFLNKVPLKIQGIIEQIICK
jgi:endonuclease G